VDIQEWERRSGNAGLIRGRVVERVREQDGIGKVEVVALVLVEYDWLLHRVREGL